MEVLFDNFLDIWQNWIVVKHQWKNFLIWFDLFAQKFGSGYSESFVDVSVYQRAPPDNFVITNTLCIPYTYFVESR